MCSAIQPTELSMASGLNAGCVITRWRRHSAASESSSPWPEQRLDVPVADVLHVLLRDA